MLKGWLTQQVIIQTDAQGVVNLKQKDKGRCEIVSILHEINDMSGGFENLELNRVGRGANELTHLCASRASSNRRHVFELIVSLIF